MVRMLTPLINLLRNTRSGTQTRPKRKGGKGARDSWPGPYSPSLPTPWCEGGEHSRGARLEKALQRRVHCVRKGPESTLGTDYLEGAERFTLRLRELGDDDSQHSKYSYQAYIGSLLFPNFRWGKGAGVKLQARKQVWLNIWPIQGTKGRQNLSRLPWVSELLE